MSQLSVAHAADIGFLFLTVGIVVFGAYKAFSSRKVLVDPSYRKWAVWTGILLILGILYEIDLARHELGLDLTGPTNQVFAAVALAGALVSFALMDRTIRVSLGFDYFHRDVLLWRRGGREVWWTAAVFAVSSYLVFNFYYGWIITFAAVAYVLAVLLLSVVRAHEDVMLDYIRWFGVAFASALVSSTLAAYTGYNFLQVFVGYSFYRAAGSLSGSTFHFDVSRFISAPRDFVFSVYTNPEMMTKITKSYLSVTLQEKDSDGKDVVKAETEILGRRFSFNVLRKYIPPDGMEEEAVSDVGIGATRFTFIPENGGTRLNCSIDFEPKGALSKLLGGLGVRQIRRQFDRDFETGKKFCEANRPT